MHYKSRMKGSELMVKFLTVEPIWEFQVMGIDIAITQAMIVSLVLILLAMIAVLYLTRNLTVVPNTKRQLILEEVYNFIYSTVKDNIGERNIMFVPFVGSIILYLILINLVGLFGIQPPTTSFSTTLGLGLTSFLVIHGYAIKSAGVGNYVKSYFKPYPFLFPITLMDRLLLPVSLSLRLFGNLVAATTIMSLAYGALGELNFFAQLIIPIPLHLYFDVFDGALQAVIFTFLTMIHIKLLSDEALGEHE